MRGETSEQTSLITLRNPEDFVPKGHPIRSVKKLADAALKKLSPVFDEMYSARGRPSIPPEVLLKSSLLIALYSVRSERLFCEQLGYNLLFRWFLDVPMEGSPFDASTFSKNRERLMDHEVARIFFLEVVEQARAASLMSSEHFSVDGTLIEAWASMKSFQVKAEAPVERRKARNKRKKSKQKRPKGPSNPSVDFHGEKRSNETHESKTDPEAKLYRKGNGRAAQLCYGGHALMENRNGLLVDFRISEANGTAERDYALFMLNDELPGSRQITVGADKGYDTRDFVDECRYRGITPHVAQNTTNRRSAIDERTTRHDGYTVSQRVRKRIEEIFGWMKTVGGLRKTRYKGQRRTQHAGYLVAAAYNLIRMARLTAA
jgi:transposase